MPEALKPTPSLRQQLLDSGIAQRMLNTIKKTQGYMDPPITVSLQDCSFKVIRATDQHAGPHTQVVITWPNEGPNKETSPQESQAFGVRSGQAFGASNENPLTPEQYALVENLANQWEAEQRATKTNS